MIEHIIIRITDYGIQPVSKKEFSGSILSNTDFKIYIVVKDGAFVYIGKTKQKIGDRFRGNFDAYKKAETGNKGSNGYSGYKWIKLIKMNSLIFSYINFQQLMIKKLKQLKLNLFI